MKTIKLLTALCFTLAFANANAQDNNDTNSDIHTIGITIPAVTLVDIEPELSKNITIPFTAPLEAGLPVTSASNNSLWLNYSYIPTALGKTGKVDVKIDALITGIDINVTAGVQEGTGRGGAVGVIAGSAITLGTAANISIITSIPGASYTGDGENNGHNLTYSLNVAAGNYAGLFASTKTATVTYTIGEN